MSEPAATAELRSAAARLGLAALVFVGVDGSTLGLGPTVDGPEPAATDGTAAGGGPVSDAVSAGRRWLDQPDAHTRDIPSATRSSSRTADGGPVDDQLGARPRPAAQVRPRRSDPLFVPLVDGTDRMLGVVVADKPADLAWARDEIDAVVFIVESRAAAIDARARGQRRPRLTEARARILRAAVEDGELSLAFQPEYDLVTGRVVAVEALVRWQHPQFGEVGPEWLLTLAEQTGLTALVGNWVLDESLRMLAGWRTVLPRLDAVVRVNVSPSEVTAAFAERVAARLDQYDVPGDLLCLELTEQEALRDAAQVGTVLGALRARGVTSAMDDIATGYSTPSRLRHVAVDVLKIDRSLVAGISCDARAQAIVTALVGLSLNFDCEIVAEGVEDAGDLDTLVELGCTRVQGHLLGRPADADATLDLLRSPPRIVADHHVL